MEESESSLAFLRDLLHELKDPFAALYGGLELSGRSSPLTGPERDRLETSLRRNSHAMKRVLDDASLYLRLAAGGMKTTPAPAQATNVLRQAVEDARPHLETRGQSVSVGGPELALHIDEEALRRCLACMLGSMSRVCSHGETFDLRLVGPEQGLIAIHLSVAGREPRSGGQGPDFRERLARQLAAVFEGEISRPALDSWTLELKYQRAEETPTEPQPGAGARRRPLRILVVDDNRDGADTLSMWLEARGYQVATTYDGNRGWDEFQRWRPDVGLFDVGLPGRNGYELARAAREAGFGGALVAITGYGQEQDRAQALQAGFDHHLVKPVDLAVLGELLEKLRAPHVLVVEDNPVARQILTVMFGKLGAGVTAVGTGEEGIRRALSGGLDLVICDLGLPGGLSGYDLARRLRREGQPRCPLVALTGDATAREEALGAGFDRVLEKPADLATLRALLERGASVS